MGPTFFVSIGGGVLVRKIFASVGFGKQVGENACQEAQTIVGEETASRSIDASTYLRSGRDLICMICMPVTCM